MVGELGLKTCLRGTLEVFLELRQETQGSLDLCHVRGTGLSIWNGIIVFKERKPRNRILPLEFWGLLGKMGLLSDVMGSTCVKVA